MYEVEEWLKWEYPSNWSYVESFNTLEEAKDYILNQTDNGDYRIITEHWRNN